VEDYEEERFGLPLSPVMRATIFLRGVAEAVVEQGSYINPDGTTGGVTVKPPLWSAVVGCLLLAWEDGPTMTRSAAG
jgi:hypothetical protein